MKLINKLFEIFRIFSLESVIVKYPEAFSIWRPSIKELTYKNMSHKANDIYFDDIIDGKIKAENDASYTEGELNLSLAEHIEADARNKRRDIHDLGNIKVSDIPY